MASCAAALVVGGTLSATLGYAQFRRRIFQEPNASYDGKFTFVRLSYTVYGRSGWEFDYPAMERNFMTILNDLTSVHPHVRESNIHAMDDPELGRYPVAYLSEPGWWRPVDSQAAGAASSARNASGPSSRRIISRASSASQLELSANTWARASRSFTSLHAPEKWTRPAIPRALASRRVSSTELLS